MQIYIKDSEDKIAYIQDSLRQGASREKIAEMMGYKTWRSLDIYMRRKGMKWDTRKKIYAEPLTAAAGSLHYHFNASQKIKSVLCQFSREEADPLQIALQNGFKNHREMSLYMSARGYRWSTELNNYVSSPTPAAVEEVSSENDSADRHEQKDNTVYSYEIKDYRDLLDTLMKHKDSLYSLLLSAKTPGTVPRYIISGVTRTKSFYMSDQLAQVLNEFSHKFNISQREIIEGALIEYMQKYSFKSEIDCLLERR